MDTAGNTALQQWAVILVPIIVINIIIIMHALNMLCAIVIS